MIPNPHDPVFAAAFRAALVHQAIIIALSGIALSGITLWLARAGARGWLPERQARATRPPARRPGHPGYPAEPAGRRGLRIGFGILWVLDGLLQAQPAMPVGLPYQVIQPSAAGSPGWVQALVNWAVTLWSEHPTESAASVVWIQLGIGAWLLAASRGRWSRAAGLASAAWALAVWACGEAFGGIFAPGLTVATGAPGAVAFYAVAGGLLALPARAWHGPRLGRAMLSGLAVFLAGMAALQAWPGNGFWHGTPGGQPGAMAGMAAAPPPGLWTRMLNLYATLHAGHAFAVNLCVVVALAVLGLGLGAAALTGRRRLARVAVMATITACLAVWVLVQNFGFLGGLGTDPNSMPPLALLVGGGYLALVRATGPPGVPDALDLPEAPVAAGAPGTPAPVAWRWRGWAGLAAARRLALSCRLVARASARSVASAGAVGLILAGAVPAAVAAGGTADPILARSLASANMLLDYPAPPFRLADQSGRGMSLTALRGKVVLLAFLDPACAGDCPPLARELGSADQILGPAARRVELVAIVAGTGHWHVADTAAFTRREGLSQVPNWHFLTGTTDRLRQVWKDYAIAERAPGPGLPSGNSDIVLVIGPGGQVTGCLEDDQALWTAAGEASFAALLASMASKAIQQSYPSVIS